MQRLSSADIRERFLEFFKKRGHAILPSASLVPENDPSVLFNTAGMQPLVPYLMGQPHPLGKRLASCQKCVRTGDLEDIGDNRHFSFFEMLGNWSLGDYFKKEAIAWSYEFLTSKEEGLGLDPTRLAVTIFAGDANAPFDQESKEIWMSLGIPEHRIYALPADDNWWSPGDNGPCGPCSEMFYDMQGEFMGVHISHDEFLNLIKNEKFIEIWNDVFMEYEKKDGKVIGKLSQRNVDTGAGLERLTAVMQGKDTAYDTDLFEDIMKEIKRVSGDKYDIRSARIVADHIRAASFLIVDGVIPGNKDQGYVLRRLIRRAVRYVQKMNMDSDSLIYISGLFEDKFKLFYHEFKDFGFKITDELEKEKNKFLETLSNGLKEFEKGTDPFILATTYGFPIELTEELASEKGVVIDREDFNQKMKEHQKLSSTASAGMFKGGLANHNEKTIKLHTAHHLLLAALQEKFGKQVKQRGSNITEERLRMDFVFDRKLTDEEKKEIENRVNEWINAGYPVVRKEMSLTEAEKLGAEMEFGAKYPEMVSVYMIESPNGVISKEFCGGPHVSNTNEIGHFKIQKEEASSQGVRRIKAILE
jgi:alanyl-tRNA synthetase